MPDSNLRRDEEEAAADDLKELLREAEKALSHAGEAGEKFDDLRERLRAAVSPNGHFSFADIRDEAVLRVKQADSAVRRNPYLSLGIAAGIGALIGIIVSRRSETEY